jgi:hypothetical protein
MIKTLLFLLVITSTNCCSQSLLMFKKNNHRIAYYKAGDVISFRVRGDKSKITDQIRGFEDSVIVFSNYKVSPQEISDVYVDDKTRLWYILRYKYERIFLIGGIGYLLIDVVNTGELNKETVIVSGSLIVAGLLAKLLISKRIKIKGRRRLWIIDQVHTVIRGPFFKSEHLLI